jgi:hypothetical protein
MGHTAEAAKAARRRQFAMIDFFGLNSLFLTITPDDECSFRVRLYADPNKEVSAVAHFTYNPHLKITNSNSHTIPTWQNISYIASTKYNSRIPDTNCNHKYI